MIRQTSWKTKTILFLLILAIVSIINAVILLPIGKATKSEENPYARAAPDLHQSVTDQVALLKNETLIQSMNNLWDVEMYYWPGVPDSEYSIISFPIRKSVGAKDIEMILSNRRFVKTVSGCRELPPKDAAILIGKHLVDASKAHKIEFDKCIKSL